MGPAPGAAACGKGLEPALLPGGDEGGQGLEQAGEGRQEGGIQRRRGAGARGLAAGIVAGRHGDGGDLAGQVGLGF
jgi:hypothetical protein